MTAAAVTRARLTSLTRRWQRAGDAPVLVALYLLAVAALLLPWPFGSHPPFAYNWEGYTAWRWQNFWEPPAGPLVEIWSPTDGLMTDSGQGPLVGLPVSIGVALGGLNVESMRVPVAVLVALSVPLLWLLGKRTIGAAPALLAALLLATAPPFLFYGRTATLVGISLVPLLLMALALTAVLTAPPGPEWRWSWRRVGALAAALLLGIYAYAPVRLVWPLTVGLLILAAWRLPAAPRLEQAHRRYDLAVTALTCLLIVPAAIMVLHILVTSRPDPVAVAAGYFHARGEQLVAMWEDPVAAAQFVREPATTAGTGALPATGPAIAWRLVTQNTADLLTLLLDYETRPITTEYWNQHGRFWPWWFLPFALVGAATALWTWRQTRSMNLLIPLVLFLGLTLPMLFTTRVHVGRLLPALPFALLLVAAGTAVVSAWLANLARRCGAPSLAPAIAPLMALAILAPAIVAARSELLTPVNPTRETLIAATLAAWSDEASERGGAVLVESPLLGDEIEGVHAATFRLELDDTYRFVDLRHQPAPPPGDLRPPLFWRGALPALESGEIAHPCRRLWFVAPEIADDFETAWRAAGCTGTPDSVILP